MKSKRDFYIILLALVVLLILVILNIFSVGVSIPSSNVWAILFGDNSGSESTWPFIVESRLFRSIVGLIGGGSLAVAGLILQVYFRNPLAGPGVLGISSGASLGVAAVIMGGYSLGLESQHLSQLIAGVAGATIVLTGILFISKFIRNYITLLVVGLMLGYFVSAIVNLLFLNADEIETRAYVVWGLGSFAGLTKSEFLWFVVVGMSTVLGSLFITKSLNAFVLGEDYAKSMGVNLKKVRLLVIAITSIQAAVVTVFCGPISFIGVAVPQMVRQVFTSTNYRFLIPTCFLLGAILGVLSDVIMRLFDNTLPLNTITALIGAPIILYTIIKLNKRVA